MYVKRLIEFAEEHPELFPPIGFQKKKFNWVVDIYGTHLIFKAVDQLELAVPSLARSGSGAAPILLVDKPDYAFGWCPPGQDKKRSEGRHASYMKLLKEYAAETADPDVLQLLKALDGPIDFPSALKAGDFVVFRIDGERYLHNAKQLKAFWSKRIQPEANPNSTVIPCQFCGSVSPAMERHSINFTLDKDRTKLISANKNAYESHHLKNSLIAPTCYVCEQKYGQALEYLLRREPKKNYGDHMITIGELTYVFWLRGESTEANIKTAVKTIQTADLDELKSLYKQVFKGEQHERKFNDYCLLIVSANKGRLVVRNYMEESTGVINKRVIRFFEAQRLANGTPYKLYTLAGAIYQKPSTQLTKADVQDWTNWAIGGIPLPKRILITLLKRIQAEGAMYPLHAATLKSWLVSQMEGREWTVATDEKNTDLAYMLGRAFAVLEKIQGEAINANDSLGSRYFGSASKTPKAIMGTLLANVQHHLAKIGASKRGRAIQLNNRLSDLLYKIPDIPTSLTLYETAEFGLGYYHEKQDLWTKKEESTCANN